MNKQGRKSPLISYNQLYSEILSWLNLCKKQYKWPSLKPLITNQTEYILSSLAGIWLIRYLGNSDSIFTKQSLLKNIRNINKRLIEAQDLWNYLYSIFNNLEESILESMLSKKLPELDKALKIDLLGSILQKSLDFKIKKKLAVNYTEFKSAEILVSLIKTHVFQSIIDPFCGSGRLISTYLSKLHNKEKFPVIKINDIMPSAVLIAYCRLVLEMTEFKQDIDLIKVSIGDAFELLSKEKRVNYDFLHESSTLILMNPPFTRIHRIEYPQKKILKFLKGKYNNFLNGQPGLHIYAILLAETLIGKKGYIAAILPAATIFSNYSQGIRNILIHKFNLKTLACCDKKIAYSEDSNVKEILLIATKGIESKNNEIEFIKFSDINTSLECQKYSKIKVSSNELAKEWNWTLFLKDSELLKMREKILELFKTKNGNALNLEIVRGVEMYGPNFFFIPNKNWKIIKDSDEEIVIKSEEKILAIPRKFLKLSLRKPGNYLYNISPNVSDYALSISTSNNMSYKWLSDYISISEVNAQSAKLKFKTNWLNHIHSQIQTKNPFGYLFLIDKFSITSTAVLAHFQLNKLICTKNFYVIRNLNKEEAALIAAWLNSSFFLILFLCSRREISGSYGRLQISDYMREPLFIDFSKISEEKYDLIIKEFEKIRQINLPTIPNQLISEIKKPLDLSFGKMLNFSENEIEKLLREIYEVLNTVFSEFTN